MSTPALSSCRHTSHADTLPLMSTHTPSPHGRHTLPLLSLCRHTLSSSCLPLLLSSSCPPPHADTPSSLSSYRHTPNPSPPPLSPHTDTPSLSPHVDTASLSTCRHAPPLMAPSPHTGTPSCRHTLLIPTHPSPHALLSTHPMPAHTHTDTPSLLPPPYVDTASYRHALPSCLPLMPTPHALLISTQPYVDTPLSLSSYRHALMPTHPLFSVLYLLRVVFHYRIALCPCVRCCLFVLVRVRSCAPSKCVKTTLSLCQLTLPPIRVTCII